MGVSAPAKPQHMRALDRANEVRLARSVLRREITAMPQREGKLRAAELIADPPDCLVAAPLGYLLIGIRRMGKMSMANMLSRLALRENKQIGTLSPRQCQELVDHLRKPPSRR